MSNIHYLSKARLEKQIEEELKELDLVDAFSKQRRQELVNQQILLQGLTEQALLEYERRYGRIGG